MIKKVIEPNLNITLPNMRKVDRSHFSLKPYPRYQNLENQSYHF